jgi:hypothetical protein
VKVSYGVGVLPFRFLHPCPYCSDCRISEWIKSKNYFQCLGNIRRPAQLLQLDDTVIGDPLITANAR